MCFFKNTVGNKASMAPKCPVMGADFSKMETNCFPFFGCSFLPFRCRGWNGVKSGSRKVIQQEVDFSHGSAHDEGGVRGHGELSQVRSGLLWTSAFPAKGKEMIRFNKMHQFWDMTG